MITDLFDSRGHRRVDVYRSLGFQRGNDQGQSFRFNAISPFAQTNLLRFDITEIIVNQFIATEKPSDVTYVFDTQQDLADTITIQ